MKMVIRPVTDNEFQGVVNWVVAMVRISEPYRSMVSRDFYNSALPDVIWEIMETANILIACHPDDPTETYGAVVYGHYEGETHLHALYVFEGHRRQGVARTLCNSIPFPAYYNIHAEFLAGHAKKAGINYYPLHLLEQRNG